MNDKRQGIHKWLEQGPLVFCTQEKKHQGTTLIAKLKSVQMLETAGQSCVHNHQFSQCLALIKLLEKY